MKACQRREILRRRRTNQKRRLLLEADSGPSPDEFVTLQMSFEDDNLETTITDDSSYNHTFTNLEPGNTFIHTGQAKDGSTSLFCNVATSGLSFTPHADFNPGAGDYTIEFWMYRLAHNVNAYAFDFSWAKCKFYTPTSSPNKLAYYVTDDNSSLTGPVYGTNVAPYPAWNHHAMCRDGDTVYCYVNGELDATIDVTGDTANADLTPCYILNNGNLTAGFGGDAWTDMFRVTTGYARYPNGDSFTPPESFLV